MIYNRQLLMIQNATKKVKNYINRFIYQSHNLKWNNAIMMANLSMKMMSIGINIDEYN